MGEVEWPKVIQVMLGLAMFSVMIHAMVNVIKGLLLKPIVFLTDIITCLFKGKVMGTATIKSLVFVLAFLCCKTFDYDAMTDLLGVAIADDNGLAWNLAYFGTSSIVYEGVDVVFMSMKRFRSTILNGTKEEVHATGG